MKRKFDLYLNDILKAISKIKQYVRSRTLEELIEDEMAFDAVLRNLEIVGEAATQMPAEVKDKYEQVPWKDIQDFRIVVAHHYWKVNEERIWDIIQNKLDALKKQIEGILSKNKQK